MGCDHSILIVIDLTCLFPDQILLVSSLIHSVFSLLWINRNGFSTFRCLLSQLGLSVSLFKQCFYPFLLVCDVAVVVWLSEIYLI